MIQINETIIVPEEELQFEFVRSSGPGGQNVNKVSTAVQLRFDVARSPSLPEPVRVRLNKLAGKKINRDGVLVITARRYRSQGKNRQDALRRLKAMIDTACIKPKRRIKTRPGQEAVKNRIQKKRRRAAIKRQRQNREWQNE